MVVHAGDGVGVNFVRVRAARGKVQLRLTAGLGVDRGRGEPHAHAAGAADVAERGRRLEEEAAAVLNGAAVAVGPLVHAVLDELVDQIAVRRVQLDAVEAGLHGIAAGVAVVVHDARDLLRLQRPRHGALLDALVRARLERHARARVRHHRRGGRDRGQRQAARRQQRVLAVGGRGDAPSVPELHEDLAALRVHGLGHRLPRLRLRVGPDAGDTHVPDRLGRDAGRLRDQQPALRGALRVVLHVRVVGAQLRLRAAVASERRQHDAVVQADGAGAGAGLQRLEERRVAEAGHLPRSAVEKTERSRTAARRVRNPKLRL